MSLKMPKTTSSSNGAATATRRHSKPIVERYQRLLFTVALRMLGDHDEASDAAQNAFVKAYQKLDTFDQSRRFFSWIYRILLNECLNLRRDRRPHERLTPELATVGGPAELLEATERRRRVQAAIRALPIEYREVDRVETLHRAVVRRDRRSAARAGQDREVATPYGETASQPDAAGSGFPLMTDHDSDPTTAQLLDELGPADPPAGFTGRRDGADFTRDTHREMDGSARSARKESP